jgi:hypothetical protein
MKKKCSVIIGCFFCVGAFFFVSLQFRLLAEFSKIKQEATELEPKPILQPLDSTTSKRSIDASAASDVKLLSTTTKTRLGAFRKVDVAEDKKVPQNIEVVKEAFSQPRKNSRVAYITFTYLQTAREFEKKIFPSLDTWLSGDDNPTYYVVMNEMWQQNYTRLCETNENYCSRIQVLWTHCEEGYFGAPPCCKMQQGLIQMIDHHSQEYDYFAYLDDDDYLARSYIEMLTLGLDASEPFIMASGRYSKGQVLPLGQQGYMRPSTQQYRCRTDPQFQYAWGQPVIYSRGALEKISRGLRLEGLTKQCAEYKVMHDVGNQVFHWMYSLPELRIRITGFPKDNWRADNVGMHNVGSDKRRDRATFYEVHKRFQKLQNKFTLVYKWNNVTGFRETQTFCDHGDPSEWTTSWNAMPVEDCLANLTLSRRAKCLYKDEQLTIA